MEFPFGHRHHKPHNREEEEEYPPPPPSHHHQPPPNYPPPGIGYPPPGAGYPPPPYQQPPPPHYNVYQDPQPDRFNPNPMGGGYPQPPPPAYGYGSAPGYPPVQHISHEYGNPAYEPDRPQYPHELHHEQHHHHGGPGPIPPPSVYHESHQGGSSELLNKPTVRVYSKAEVNYSLTIRDGKVILARSDPSDRFQHWIKDLKYSTKVKDEEGFPSFALVNQATGQALKHSIGATHPVQLTPYNPNVLDESVLWTESKDLGDTYRCIRMVNNIRLNLDALNGDKNHGGVHDGTIAVLWEWKKGDNQRWKIAPYCLSGDNGTWLTHAYPRSGIAVHWKINKRRRKHSVFQTFSDPHLNNYGCGSIFCSNCNIFGNADMSISMKNLWPIKWNWNYTNHAQDVRELAEQHLRLRKD